MRSIFCVLLLVICVFSGCDKVELIGDKYISLSYSQTYCSDPWDTLQTDSATINSCIHYLDSMKLYVAAISIKSENIPESCMACTCKTGKLIHLTTLDNELMKGKYGELGFK